MSSLTFVRLYQLTIVPLLGRSGLKKADAFPVSSIGFSPHSPSSTTNIFFISLLFQIDKPQESNGDSWSWPGARALQPFPGHQRELHRAAQVRPRPNFDTIFFHFSPFRDGSLLGIAPGGAREAYFGDSSYPILWGSRCTFFLPLNIYRLPGKVLPQWPLLRASPSSRSSLRTSERQPSVSLEGWTLAGVCGSTSMRRPKCPSYQCMASSPSNWGLIWESQYTPPQVFSSQTL